MITVRLSGDSLHVQTPYSQQHLAANIPQRRWLPKLKVWACRPSFANFEYMVRKWPNQIDWDDASLALYKKLRADAEARAEIKDANLRNVIGVEEIDAEIAKGLFASPAPWDHQKRALALGRGMDYFAYFLDQGTGKTRIITDDAGWNYRAGRCNGLLLLNKNSVKTNWVSDDPAEPDAIDTWLPEDIVRFKGLWTSDTTKAQRLAWEEFMDRAVADREDGLAVLSVNYESLQVDRAYNDYAAFCKNRDVMIAADESTRMGYPGTDTTRNALKLRRLCPLARIATGTPIVQTPLKAYSQLRFLSEDILGFGSFFAFKTRYCVMGGYKNKQVIQYQNLEELSEKIKSCSYRALKSDCMDLPPKVYKKRRVYMSEEQGHSYDQMRELMQATVEDKTVSAIIRLTQVMRLQQITGGYVKADDGSMIELVPPDRNPLIKEVRSILEERGQQRFLIWAHFHEEVEALERVLTEAGYKVASFYGKTPEKDRMPIRRAFARGEYDGIIANASTGGMGIDEFKIAPLVIFYSNSDKTEDRIQAEDRTHRGGSEVHDSITYIDIVVPNTVRVKLIRTLRNNKSLSDTIMKDGVGEWI